MLSRKTRYAIMALARLAQDYGHGPVRMSEISQKELIPLRFLENILLELKQEGIVDSHLGVKGGYFLIRNPEEITLADIVSHFEGSLGMLWCTSPDTHQPCDFLKNEGACKIRKVFCELHEATEVILSRKTLKDLV